MIRAKSVLPRFMHHPRQLKSVRIANMQIQIVDFDESLEIRTAIDSHAVMKTNYKNTKDLLIFCPFL